MNSVIVFLTQNPSIIASFVGSSGGGEGESSLPALPEETKQYYKDSLQVLGEIRNGLQQGSIIKMNRDVVGRSTSQSQSESGVNRAQLNK